VLPEYLPNEEGDADDTRDGADLASEPSWSVGVECGENSSYPGLEGEEAVERDAIPRPKLDSSASV
jgi:hypothetical protein